MVRVKIETNALFSRALIRVRAKIEKNTFFGKALVRKRAKIEKTHFLVGLWLGLGQNRENHPF